QRRNPQRQTKPPSARPWHGFPTRVFDFEISTRNHRRPLPRLPRPHPARSRRHHDPANRRRRAASPNRRSHSHRRIGRFMKPPIDDAVKNARRAQETWSALRLESREQILKNFADQLRQNKNDLREIISEETGKPRWESATEVDAMINKIPISIDASRS